MDHTFCKSERLYHKILFEELLASDFSFVSYPFRVIAKVSSQPDVFPGRIAVSISKKKFKRAVKRNRLKRLTREAYRLHKNDAKEGKKFSTVDMLFIYIDSQIQDYSKIEKAVCRALQKIVQHFNELSPHA